MFEKGKYKGFSNQQIIQDLKSRGYSPLLISEKPNDHLDPHSHEAYHILVVVDGEMKVRLKNKEFKMFTGDMVTINSKVEHAAYFGKKGCKYFWIEF